LYNNTPSNATLNTASNISYRPLIQADVLQFFFMNELKNLSNVVIGKLGKLVHKQNWVFFLNYFINYNIIINIDLNKLDTLLLKQKKLPVLDITGFFFAWVLRWKRNPLYPIRGASFVSIVLHHIQRMEIIFKDPMYHCHTI
jgi:hypothetical protein